jgi:hypothetical protein
MQFAQSARYGIAIHLCHFRNFMAGAVRPQTDSGERLLRLLPAEFVSLRCGVMA